MLCYVIYRLIVHRGNIVSIHKTMANEPKQTKTTTFCSGCEKSRLEWLLKEPFLNFL